MKNVWVIACKVNKCPACSDAKFADPNLRFDVARYYTTREKARNDKNLLVFPQSYQILGPYALY